MGDMWEIKEGDLRFDVNRSGAFVGVQVTHVPTGTQAGATNDIGSEIDARTRAVRALADALYNATGKKLSIEWTYNPPPVMPQEQDA